MHVCFFEYLGLQNQLNASSTKSQTSPDLDKSVQR